MTALYALIAFLVIAYVAAAILFMFMGAGLSGERNVPMWRVPLFNVGLAMAAVGLYVALYAMIGAA